MTYDPKYLRRWTLPDHYFGAKWPEYYSSSVGQSRDSSALERSNFDVMLRDLGGETDTVIVVRESHWVVGWVEWIAIHESDIKALATADRNRANLNDYPILDESHWSDLERYEADQVWQNCFNDRERLAYMREHKSQFEFYDFSELIGCARGRCFSGYAGDLLN